MSLADYNDSLDRKVGTIPRIGPRVIKGITIGKRFVTICTLFMHLLSSYVNKSSFFAAMKKKRDSAVNKRLRELSWSWQRLNGPSSTLRRDSA